MEKSGKKPYINASGQEQSSRPDISPLQIPTFSGKLENYTININSKICSSHAWYNYNSLL